MSVHIEHIHSVHCTCYTLGMHAREGNGEREWKRIWINIIRVWNMFAKPKTRNETDSMRFTTAEASAAVPGIISGYGNKTNQKLHIVRFVGFVFAFFLRAASSSFASFRFIFQCAMISKRYAMKRKIRVRSKRSKRSKERQRHRQCTMK